MHARHNPLDTEALTRRRSELFIHNTDFEWLSLNWRKYRAAHMSASNRRMILKMFESDFQYFPTLKEIRDGIVNAQMNVLQQKSKVWSNKTKFQMLKRSYADRWDMLFQVADLGNLEEPLTSKILANPEHPITRHIMYLYSMETFIYEDLNRAARYKDLNQIPNFGAFAAALSFIICCANARRTDEFKLSENTTLYRGVKLREEKLKEYKEGDFVNLTGYTSSSKNKEVALKFALYNVKEGQVPVLFEI